MANTPNSLFDTDLFNNNLFNGNLPDLSNPLDISSPKGLPQIGIVAPPTKSAGATDLKTVIDQNEILQEYYDNKDKEKRKKGDEKVDVQIEEKLNKALKNMSPWEGDRVQREADLRNEYAQRINANPEQKDALLQELAVKLDAINNERELEKQGIRPDRPLHINPYDQFSPNFSNTEKKLFEATAALKEKFDWTFPNVNTKRKEQLQGAKKGTIIMQDADSGVISGLLGDTRFRLTSYNAQHQNNGMFDAIDSFEQAIMNPNKYATQSVLVHRLLGKDLKEAVTKQEWEACHAYGKYLMAKYAKGELTEYEAFNLNKVDYYNDYFEKNKEIEVFYKEYGKDEFDRTLIDIINDKNESLAVGLTFNPLINASFSVDKASDYIEASHRMSEALYAKQEMMILAEKQVLRDAKDTDGTIGEKWDMFKARGVQVLGSLFAINDYTEKFMSEYVLGKGAGAWREFLSNQQLLNYTFGVKNSTWLEYQADMERASKEFANGHYLNAAAIYASNVVNLIVLSGPDMLATIGLTAALGPVGAYFGLTGTAARSLLGLYARSFMAGSLISGTAQTVADMHEFEVKNGRPMNFQEMARSWGMNGLGLMLEGVLGGGMLARLIPGVPPYLISTPRKIVTRGLSMAGLTLAEEAGTEAVQEYLQNAISAANVRGGNYTSSLLSELMDWRTHGAEALAGAITGGAMSGITQLPTYNGIRKNLQSNQEKVANFEDYSVNDFDEAGNLIKGAVKFTPEQLQQSHQLLSDLTTYSDNILQSIQQNTLSDNFETIFEWYTKSLTQQKSQFTQSDYLAAKNYATRTRAEVFRYWANQLKGDRVQFEELIDKVADLLSGNASEIKKLNFKQKYQFIIDMFNGTVLGSGPGTNYVDFLVSQHAKNPKKYPAPNLKKLGKITALTPDYDVIKNIIQDFRRYHTGDTNLILTDEEFQQEVSKMRKYTEDVHEEFLWKSEYGHSVYQFRSDILGIKGFYQDAKADIEKLLLAKGKGSAVTININGGTNVVTTDQLIEAIGRKDQQYQTWLNQDATLAAAVTTAINLRSDLQETWLSLLHLCELHKNKYTGLGNFLEGHADEAVCKYTYTTRTSHSYTLHRDQFADPNSKTNKWFGFMKEECNAAISTIEEVGKQIFGDNLEVTEPDLFTLINNYRQDLAVAEMKIEEYRLGAKQYAAGITPTGSKVIQNSKNFARYSVKYVMSYVYRRRDRLMKEAAYRYLKEHNQLPDKVKSYTDLTDSQVEKRFKKLFMEETNKDAAILKATFTLPGGSTMTLGKLRSLYFEYTDFITKELADAKDLNAYGEALQKIFGSNKTASGEENDSIEYLKNNIVQLPNGNLRFVGMKYNLDFRDFYLNLKEKDRADFTKMLRMVIERNKFAIPSTQTNINKREVAIYPYGIKIADAFYNMNDIIKNDALLQSLRVKDHEFAFNMEGIEGLDINTDNMEKELKGVFNNPDIFPVAKVNDDEPIETALEYFKYKAKDDQTGNYKAVEVDGKIYYVVSNQAWGQLTTNPVVTYPHPEGYQDKANTKSACSMYDGILNLGHIASTDSYVFSLTNETNPGKAADIVFAEVQETSSIRSGTDPERLVLADDNELSCLNKNLTVKFTRADGTVFNVQYGDAVLLCSVLKDGTKMLDVLNKIDATDANWETKLRMEMDEQRQKSEIYSYEYGQDVFTHDEIKANRTLFLDYLYVQALKEHNIDIVQKTQGIKYITTGTSSFYAPAEITARALALAKAGKTGTKQELIDSYGVADSKYDPVGPEGSAEHYKASKFKNVTLKIDEMNKRDDMFLRFDANNSRDSKKEKLLNRLQTYFVSSLKRTYRGLDYDNIQKLVDILTEDQIENLYFSLNSIEDGLTPLDRAYMASQTNLSPDFYAAYDKNIDEICKIPVFAEMLSKYDFGSMNQKRMDFLTNHDLNILEHTYEPDYKVISEPMMTAMEKEGTNSDILLILKVLSGKNFKKKGSDELDTEYELFTKGYYWMKLQTMHHQGKLPDAVKKVLDRLALTKQAKECTLTLSDGTQCKIYNPISYMENSIPFSLGMDVNEINNAGYIPEVLESVLNNNAAFEDSVYEFITPIIENREKKIYIKQAINRQPQDTKGIISFHKILETTLRNDPKYTAVKNNTISLKDRIQEIYDNPATTVGQKINDMIQAMYSYGIDVNTIQNIARVLKTDKIEVEILDISHMKFRDFLEEDKTNTTFRRNNNYNLLNSYSCIEVDGVRVSISNILEDIIDEKSTSKYYPLLDLEITKGDNIGVLITRSGNKDAKLAVEQALFSNLKIPQTIQLKVNPVVSTTYTAGSAIATATKNLTKTKTGIGTITIDDRFCNLYNGIYTDPNHDYKSDYADEGLYDDLFKFLKEYKIISKNKKRDQFNPEDYLKNIPAISYSKKTRKYYWKGHEVPLRYENFAKKLFAKKIEYDKTNDANIDQIAVFIEALFTSLKTQGVKKLRIANNITVKTARDRLEHLLTQKLGIEVEFAKNNLNVTEATVTDFLAGTGITYNKVSSKYNFYARRLLNSILGNGLLEDRSDFVIALGGFNPYLATALGDKLAITGLFKKYADDDTEEAFKAEFDKDVKAGNIDPDNSKYIGMTSSDEEIAIDTTDAFVYGLKRYIGGAGKGPQDMDAAIDAWFDMKQGGLGQVMQEFSTKNVSDIRSLINEKVELLDIISKRSYSADIIYNNILTAVRLTNPPDSSTDPLVRYIYRCMQDGTGIYMGLQNALRDNNHNLYFTLDGFLKEKKISIKDNDVNYLNSDDYLVVKTLADEMIRTKLMSDSEINGKSTPSPYVLLAYETFKPTVKKAVNKEFHYALLADQNSSYINNSKFLLEAALARRQLIEAQKTTANTNDRFVVNTIANILEDMANTSGTVINDLATAETFIKQNLQNAKDKAKEDTAVFKEKKEADEFIKDIADKVKNAKSITAMLAVNTEIQEKLIELDTFLQNFNTSNTATSNLTNINKQAYTSLQQLAITTTKLVNAIQTEYSKINASNMAVEDKCAFNSIVYHAQNYIYSFDPNNAKKAKELNNYIISINNQLEYEQRPDVTETRERFERQLKIYEASLNRVSQKKNIINYQAAIDNAVTPKDKEQAWIDYFNSISKGLVEVQRSARTMLDELETFYNKITSESFGGTILREPFNAKSIAINKLKDRDGFAQEYFGQYEDLLNKFSPDEERRKDLDEKVKFITRKSAITFNYREAKSKASLLGDSALSEEVLLYLTDIQSDAFKANWLAQHHNKLSLSELTQGELMQILMVMLKSNPSLMLLYDIKKLSTGDIQFNLRPETVLIALSSASQVIDQFSSMTEKSAEDIMRILGISSTGDNSAAVLKAQRMLNNVGAPRLTVWRSFGNAFLDTAGIQYISQSDDDLYMEKDGLTDALGRFTFNAVTSVWENIVEYDDKKTPYDGHKVPRSELEQLFGQMPKRDISFYKFKKETTRELKNIGNNLAVNVFTSVGNDIDLFSIGKPVNNKHKLPRGSEFRPIIYQTDKDGNIVRDKDGKPVVKSQLPPITIEMLDTLNKEAFVLSYDTLQLMRDMCNNPMQYLRSYGYKTTAELNNMPELDRLSAQGENTSYLQQLEAVRQMLKKIEEYQAANPNKPVEIYFDWEQIVSGRFQLKGSLFNPQNNKMLRAVLVAQGTNKTWNLSDKGTQAKELFAIAQCFDCLSDTKRGRIKFMLDNITYDEAKRLYQSVLTVDDKTFEKMWVKYGLGIEERSLALQAAYHLVKRCEAKQKNQTVFKSNLMVEDDSTTSGYFLKMLLFPNRKIIRDYGIKVGAYNEADRTIAKAFYGVDYQDLDIDQLKKMAFFQDVYRTQAITTDEILNEPDTVESFLVDIDKQSNEKKIKAKYLSGHFAINEDIINALKDNTANNVFSRSIFLKALPKVDRKHGLPVVSKEFREMLKPITMVFSYGAGKNRIVSQLSDTLYDQIYGDLNKIVYCPTINRAKSGFDDLQNQIEKYVKGLSQEQIEALYPKAALFAYNLCKLSPKNNQGITRMPKGIDVDDITVYDTDIATPFKDKRQDLYVALVKYGKFYSLAVKGVWKDTEVTNPITKVKTTESRPIYFSPQDILVAISPKKDSSGNVVLDKNNNPIYTTLSFDQAIKNVFAATYGEAVYEGLRRDFGQFIQINDAINTMQAVNTNIMQKVFNDELDYILETKNKALVGLNEDDDRWEKERSKAFSKLTKRDVQNLYRNLIDKKVFPTGPNAASLLNWKGQQDPRSEADRYLNRVENLLGGIQIAERDPISTMFNDLDFVFSLDGNHHASIESHSLYSMFNYVTNSGLRPAVSTIHSTDAWVLSKTVIDAAKKKIYATPIHDALFMSALDMDTVGSLYNSASLQVGAQFEVLTNYVKWFEALLNAGGYEKDVLVAHGQPVTVKDDHATLRALSQRSTSKATKKLAEYEATQLIENGEFKGTKLTAFGLTPIQISSLGELFGRKEDFEGINSQKIASQITAADLLRQVWNIANLYDNPVTGYRAKFYSNTIDAFNLAGIDVHAKYQGTGGFDKGKRVVLSSRPGFDLTSAFTDNSSTVLLNGADTTKENILKLLDTLGQGENLAYVQRLRSMLDQFLDVDTLMGWVVSQENIRNNNAGLTDPEKKVITLYNQDPRFAATSYSQSKAEVYAHELVHALFDFAFNNQQNPKIASAILRLRVLREYVIKNKLITEDDFYNATGITEEEAKARAKDWYDYIFTENEKEPDRGLKEFLSFVLTNETMFNKLQDVKIQGQNKKSILGLIFDVVSKMFKTLFGKMETFLAFSGMIDQLSGNLLNDGDTVFETAVKLCMDIKKANTTAETLLEKAASTGSVATDFINSVRDTGNNLVTPLLKTFSNIPNLAIKLGSGGKAEVAAKLIALAPFNKEVREGLHSYLSMLGTELTGGYLNDLINDLKSSDDYTFDVARVGRKAQHIDAIEKRAYEILQKKLRNEFKSLTLDQEDALSVYVRGNLHCWLNYTTENVTDPVAFIQQLIIDQQTRNNMEQNLLEHNFPQDDGMTDDKKKTLTMLINNLAKYEAAIMINAKGTTFFSSYDNSEVMLNRSLYHIRTKLKYIPKNEKDFVAKMSEKVDRLASLYYLDELAKRDNKKLLDCYSLDAKGIKAYLGLHDHYVKTAAERHNLTKLEKQKEIGIVPAARLYAGTTEIRFAPKSDRAIMEHNQYKMVDVNKMVTDSNDMMRTYDGMVQKGEYAMYVRNLSSPTRIDGAAISTNALKDTSLSIDSIMSDTFDLTDEVRNEMNSNLAQTYRDAEDLQNAMEYSSNKYKSNQFFNSVQHYAEGIWHAMLTQNLDYDTFEKDILTSYYDGTRLRPYNYKDSVTLMNLDDNGIKLLSKLVSTQTVTPVAFQQNKTMVEMLNAYFDENAVRYGVDKFRDQNTKMFFLDIKPQLVKKFGSSISEILKDQDHFYVREDMIKAILGVESWSITNWKKADGRNVIPPAWYKAAWYTENLLKMFGFKAKENVVIRTPNVSFNNVISNINIHLLTESNVSKVMNMYVKNTQALFNYLKQDKKRIELQYKQDSNTITEAEEKELSRIKSALKTSPIAPLMEEGMFTSIVEDLTTLSQDGIGQITEQISQLPAVKNTPNGVKNLFKQLYMLKGTPIYEFLYHINQYSDFVARITEYQIQMERCPYKKKEQKVLYDNYEKKVLNDLWDKFIDYRVPVNRVEQYLNDIGFINFAKYFRRIQRVIGSQLVHNPVGCIMQFARQAALKPFGLDTEDIFSSNFISKNYDALILGPEKAVYNTALPGLFHLFGWFKYKD